MSEIQSFQNPIETDRNERRFGENPSVPSQTCPLVSRTLLRGGCERGVRAGEPGPGSSGAAGVQDSRDCVSGGDGESVPNRGNYDQQRTQIEVRPMIFLAINIEV